jgi:hypothetical protein
MSKYDKLWTYIENCGQPELLLSFDEIAEIAGIQIDHAFLTYKKELLSHGYKAGKISLKQSTVSFKKTESI